MGRAQEHAHAGTGTISSPLQRNADLGEDGSGGAVAGGDENAFASGGGDEGGGGSGGGSGGGAGAGAGSMSVAEGIRSLIRATWEDVKDWCDEEAEARVRRKDAQVRAWAVQ